MVHRWGAKNSDHAFMGCVQSGGEFGKREINKENRCSRKNISRRGFPSSRPPKTKYTGKTRCRVREAATSYMRPDGMHGYVVGHGEDARAVRFKIGRRHSEMQSSRHVENSRPLRNPCLASHRASRPRIATVLRGYASQSRARPLVDQRASCPRIAALLCRRDHSQSLSASGKWRARGVVALRRARTRRKKK